MKEELDRLLKMEQSIKDVIKKLNHEILFTQKNEAKHMVAVVTLLTNILEDKIYAEGGI